MAEIETSVLRIGSNDLVLQDAAARGSLAAAYSASSTYAVGDMVLKDGQLYECNTAITTAEAWTAAHWTAVAVGGELATVKDGLNCNIDFIKELSVNQNMISAPLVTGYYKNGTGELVGGFSHVLIPLNGAKLLKINGILHSYDTTQFTALGVFFDINNNYIPNCDIITLAGGGLVTFPVEINVPESAAYIAINTDYNAADYQSTLPDNLYCYNIGSVSNTKKLKILAGVIRNSGNGWEFINDSGHEPLNLKSVSVNNAGQIVVDYGFTAKKVLSLVVQPDETLVNLIDCGASVGLSSSAIDVFSKSKEIGGMAQYNASQHKWDVTYSDFTSSEFRYDGTIVLNHENLTGLYAATDVFNVSTSPGNHVFAVQTSSLGMDCGHFKIIDNSGNIVTSPDDGSRIFIVRMLKRKKQNANNIVSSTGNIWIYGVMEVD